MFALSIINYLDIQSHRIIIIIVVSLITMIFLYIYFKKIYKTKREYCGSLTFSVLYSISLFVGKSISVNNSIYPIISSFENIVRFIVSIIGFSIVFATIIDSILSLLIIKNKKSFEYKRKHFYMIWLLIILCWIPCYISYYPGIMAYDIAWQTPQALGIEPYTQLHPPLHTFIWELFIKLGAFTSLNPLVLYCVFQMIVFSYSFAVMFKYILEIKTDKRIVILSLLFVVLNPLFAIFSITITKDVLSSSFFLLSLIRILEVRKDKSLKKEIQLVIDILLSCLFRHNVFYAFLLSIIALLIINHKQNKRIVLLMGASLFICVIINVPVFNYLGIQKNNEKESLSIPIQQIATYVYRNEMGGGYMNKEEKDVINDFIKIDKIKTNLNLRFADPIKIIFNQNYYKNNKKQFWDIWLKGLTKKPIDYIDAALSLNLGYWYQDTMHPDIVTDRPYIETYTVPVSIYNFDFSRKNYLPNLNRIYENFALYSDQVYIPLIPEIFSLSLPIWLALLTLTKTILKKENYFHVLFPIIFLWLTLLGAPISNSRYILSLIVTYPPLLSILSS